MGCLRFIEAAIMNCFTPINQASDVKEIIKNRLDFAKQSKIISLWSCFTGAPETKIRNAIKAFNKEITDGKEIKKGSSLAFYLQEYS